VTGEETESWWNYVNPMNPHCATAYLTVASWWFLGSIAWMLLVMFTLYEVFEWLYFWWIDERPDKIYVDLLEYAVSLNVGVAISTLCKILL
jgi:hypothetical protein